MRRRRRLLLLALVAGRLLTPAAPAAAEPGAGASAAYVGGRVCAACHEREYERWKGSHHDLAMQEAGKETVLGNFDGATFDANGVTSTFYQKDRKFFVRTDGPDGKLHDYPISHTFGVTPLQQYLIAFPKGRYQALNIAWDTRPRAEGGQRWFHLHPEEKITHDDVLHWTGPAQQWNSMCADCHSTNLRKGYRPADATYETTWSEIDVSCEACHGPGAKHVEWAGAAAGATPGGEDRLVVRLADPEPAAWVMDAKTGIAKRSVPRRAHVEVDTCAPCHSRRTVIDSGDLAGKPFLDGHVPALLTEGLYHADGQMEDEVYVYGSFLQSKMYRAGVTCRDCHDPHRLEVYGAGNETCARCHLAAKFDAVSHHHHPPGSPGARCVECHMPARNYMVIDARHDHSFRVPRPDLTVEIGTPNACNGCHAKESAAWAAAAAVKWYGPARAATPHFGEVIHAGRNARPGAENLLAALASDASQPGIARATAVSLLARFPGGRWSATLEAWLGDGDPLVRMAAAGAAEEIEPGARLRALSPVLDDRLRAVRIEAARSLATVPRGSMTAGQRSALERGLEEYRAAQRVDLDRGPAHLNLGSLDAQLGDLDGAEREYRAAIAVAPYFIPAYVNLADVLRERGRDDEGEKLLREALDVDPDNAEVHHAFGLLLVRQKRLPEAMDELWRAARLAPEEPRYAYVYGVALHGTGSTERALEVLRAAHEKHPGDVEILLALATINRDRGAREDAIAYARRLVALSPEDPGARQLLEVLERSK
jgi:tetratricopeptide (TPR) repeat protein